MKNVFFIVSFILLSVAVQGKKNEPIAGRILFDSDWKFLQADVPGASSEGFDDAAWRSLQLPHDWSIETQISAKNPMAGAGGYFEAGIGWYRKRFEVPADWNRREVGLYFEGVYMNAEIWLNGQKVAFHPYGYTGFFCDLTKVLKPGVMNTLAVRVDNSRQINCRWYSGSGIYRHVWLTATDPLHIAQWGVAVTTPVVSREKAVIRVSTQLVNNSTKARSVRVHLTVTDTAGLKQSGEDQRIVLQPGSTQQVVNEFTVLNPALWSPDSPALYKAAVQVYEGGTLLEENKSKVGIRSIAYAAEKGFLLNGKSIKLNGGCVHHDHGCLGAAAYDRAETRKAELLKKAGFNTVRTSHNPPSEAFLRACDRLGLLVIDEAFDGWRTQKNPYDYSVLLDEWWQKDLDAMVLRDRNHPSVIMWSIGNEVIERKEPQAVETAHRFATYVRQLDPARPVTSAMTTWDSSWEIFDPLMAEHDICGYNYQMHRVESDHQRVPSRVILQTESYPREAFRNWEAVQKHSYVIGDVVWTAIDYLGESGIGRSCYPGEPKGEHWEAELFPWHGAYCGDVDLRGWRKPISHYRNLLWNNNEQLYMAVKEPNPESGVIRETMWSVWPTWESWTWPGREGRPVEVEVYSRYPVVRLYLNNKLVEEKPTGQAQEFKAVFTLPYQSGVLKAVGISSGGAEVESRVLSTAGPAYSIRLTPERTNPDADGQDLIFVQVEVLDAQGNLQPNAENPIEFEVKGAAEYLAADNGNLKDTERYISKNRKAWHGRAMLVLRTKKQKGEIQIRAFSKGLKSKAITLKSH